MGPRRVGRTGVQPPKVGSRGLLYALLSEPKNVIIGEHTMPYHGIKLLFHREFLALPGARLPADKNGRFRVAGMVLAWWAHRGMLGVYPVVCVLGEDIPGCNVGTLHIKQ